MRTLLVIFGLILAAAHPAKAQCTGVFPPNTLCGNLTGSARPPGAFSSSGTIAGPGSSTLNGLPLWANTLGTQLKDGAGLTIAGGYTWSGAQSWQGNNTFSGTNTFSAATNFSFGSFQLSGAAPSGHYPRGNGTNYVDSAIQFGDLPALNAFSSLCNPTNASAQPANCQLAILHSKDVGATGSTLTTTGTISSGTATLSLAAAINFANGEGIRVNHAGAAFTGSAPTALTVTPTGTPGSTTYTYTIACMDGSGGVGASITQVQTATGNASLTSTNYNLLQWTHGANCAGYAIYGRISGSLAMLGMTADVTGTNTFRDEGQAFSTPPEWLPAAPQGSALADWLVTSILSGGGTTSLTLNNNAITTATSQGVQHDDTVALQNWLNSAQSSNLVAWLDSGNYLITSALTLGSSQPIHITSANWFNGGRLTLVSPTQNGININDTNGRVFVDHIRITSNDGASDWAIGGASLSSSNTFGLHVSHVYFDNPWECLLTTGTVYSFGKTVCNPARAGVDTTNPGDSMITENYITPFSYFGQSLGARGINVSGNVGGLRIVNNKFNTAGPDGFQYAILATVSTSDGDFFVIANSIEGMNTAGVSFARSGTPTFANVVIVGNECSGVGTTYNCFEFPDTSAIGWLTGVVITGNIIRGGSSANGVLVNDGTTEFNISGNTILNGLVGIIIGASTTRCGIGFNNFATGVGTQITDSSTTCTFAQVTATKPTYP